MKTHVCPFPLDSKPYMYETGVITSKCYLVRSDLTMTMAKGSLSIGGLELSGTGEFGLLIVLGVMTAVFGSLGQATNNGLAIEMAVLCFIAFVAVLVFTIYEHFSDRL